MGFPRVAVVCLAKDVCGLRRIINRSAHRSWDTDGEISIIAIPDNKATHETTVSRRITSELGDKAKSIDVLLVGRLPTSLPFGTQSLAWTKTVFKNHTDFAKRIPSILEKHRIDWLSAVERRLLNAWRHGRIDRARLLQWKKQFRLAGNSEWLAEILLKRFDFWDDQRIADGFELSAYRLSGFDCIAVNRRNIGKSADVLANLIKKRLGSIEAPGIRIVDIAEIWDETHGGGELERVLYIEDGLFSGTEIVNYMEAVCGKPAPEGRKPKIDRVPSRKQILGKNIVFHFPVATSLGRRRVATLFTQEGLHNYEVTVSKGGYIDVFTENGKVAYDAGEFFSPTARNCPANPGRDIECHALAGVTYWKSPAEQKIRIDRATSICREIGYSLFCNYLDSVGYKWPEEKKRACSLGMYGLGLGLAFAHSIPKAALPLFWFGGMVEFQGKSFQWIPLFENAC